MDNKHPATELNDSALENVSGGLLVPCSEGRPVPTYSDAICAMCGKVASVRIDKWQAGRVGGLYYCDACRPNATAAEPESGD